MTNAVLRKELHSIIDAMPDNFVQAIMPMITYFADEYWKPVIEPASPEECIMIDERVREYYENPASFIPLSDVK
jgi:hypothetical protein